MRENTIRKARADELSVIQGIARRTIDQCYRPYLGDEGVDWYIDSGESDRELQKHLDNCDVLMQGDGLVAFAIYFDDLIHLMMVDVRLHRSGLGSQLLAHCEDRLFERGKKTIRLETFEGNQQAIDFYVKHGWSITGRVKDEEHDFIRVLFEKSALPSPVR